MLCFENLDKSVRCAFNIDDEVLLVAGFRCRTLMTSQCQVAGNITGAVALLKPLDGP